MGRGGNFCRPLLFPGDHAAPPILPAHPTPRTFLPDSSGLYLPHCCPPCFNQVGGREMDCLAAPMRGWGLGVMGGRGRGPPLNAPAQAQGGSSVLCGRCISDASRPGIPLPPRLPPKQRPVLSTTGAVTVSAMTQLRVCTAAALWASCCSQTGRPAKVRVLGQRGPETFETGLRLGP